MSTTSAYTTTAGTTAYTCLYFTVMQTYWLWIAKQGTNVVFIRESIVSHLIIQLISQHLMWLVSLRDDGTSMIFVADSMGQYSFKFSWWAPKDARVLKQYVMAIQGHPRSLILTPNESAYATTCWSLILNLVLSSPVSEILQISWEAERLFAICTRDKRILLNFCNTLVRPHLEYCSPAWSPYYNLQQQAQLPLRNRVSTMYFFVAKLLFYRRNDLQLRLITSEAYVRWYG